MLIISSCAKSPNEIIEAHFDDFILIDGMRGYKIQSIVRKKSDTITLYDKKRKLLIRNISELKFNRSTVLSNHNAVAKRIAVIQRGTKTYSNTFDLKTGQPIQIISYVLGNDHYSDYDNKGKDYLIAEERVNLNREIQFEKEIEDSLNILYRKIENLNFNDKKEILELRSTVIVKGITAWGQHIILYRIKQSPNGDILTVRKL
ncbi:hypothetical protein ACI513_12085 [Chryseobacterium sp. M5]|uniref:hypothetical protein n=1 Tax=Chryseobacterium sp. M5 TaxID=3379128 RepID=UPI003857465B